MKFRVGKTSVGNVNNTGSRKKAVRGDYNLPNVVRINSS